MKSCQGACRVTTRRALLITAFVIASLALVVAGCWRATRTDRERLRDAATGLHQPLHLEGLGPDEPDHYPIDMRPFAPHIEAGRAADPPFDPDGVVWVDHWQADPETGRKPRVYNPVTIAQYALGEYERHLHGEEPTLAAFFAQARWLRDAMTRDGRLEYHYSYGARGLQAPWVSAMSQGEAISVLVRAWRATGDETWLDAARLAYVPLTVPVAEGGTMIADGDDLWLEEYPHDPPSHVFNGHAFAAFGIRDLWLATGEEEYRDAWERSTRTLGAHLADYEHDGWLRYDVYPGTIARSYYYELQLDQTRALAALTDDPAFDQAAERWAEPIDSPGVYLLGRLYDRAIGRLLEGSR